MNQGEYLSGEPSASGTRARRRRRMLARVLPGGALVVAALVVPEFSVGAGDLGGGDPRPDPPEPAISKRQAGFKRVQDAGRPIASLAGVRYAPVIDRGTRTEPGAAPRLAAAAPAPLPSGVNDRTLLPGLPAVSPAAPSDFDAAFAWLLHAAPLAGPAGTAPEIAPAASAPTAPKAVQMAVVPQAPTALADAQPAAARIETPSAPTPAPTPVVTSDTAAFAAFVPEEQAALRGPAGSAPPVPLAAPAPAAVTVSAPASSPGPAPAVQVTASPVAALPRPAGRAAMAPSPEDRIPAARTIPAAAPKPAAAPSAAQLAARPTVSAAAPGARAPLAPAAATAPAAAPRPAPAAIAALPKASPATVAPASAAPARIAAPDFRARLITRVDGRTAGAIDFQQTPAGLKVRLGSVAEVLADRLDPAELTRIRTSAAGNAFLSLAELQAQGVPISYDPVYDEFNIGKNDTRPKAARKVHMDQISAPERAAGAAGMAQIPRPRTR